MASLTERRPQFMGDHPGGKKAILAYAGRDATEEFNALHSASNQYLRLRAAD